MLRLEIPGDWRVVEFMRMVRRPRQGWQRVRISGRTSPRAATEVALRNAHIVHCLSTRRHRRRHGRHPDGRGAMMGSDGMHADPLMNTLPTGRVTR